MTVYGGSLKNGTSTQCRSCRTSESNKRTKTGNKNNATHGESKSRLYRIWAGMRSRCETKSSSGFYLYGNRGIKVCEEWQQFEPFRDWALANGYADNLSIDRIDNNGNYEPANCRWATPKEQANNTSKSHYISYKGEIITLSQAAEKYSVNYGTLRNRINNLGWSTEEAIELSTEKKRNGGDVNDNRNQSGSNT